MEIGVFAIEGGSFVNWKPWISQNRVCVRQSRLIYMKVLFKFKDLRETNLLKIASLFSGAIYFFDIY